MEMLGHLFVGAWVGASLILIIIFALYVLLPDYLDDEDEKRHEEKNKGKKK